jgi:hypothetical protein
MYNSRVQGLEEHRSKLIIFWTFCRSIHQMYNRFHFLKNMLCIILPILVIIMELFVPSKRTQKNDEWTIRDCTLLIFNILCVCFLFIFVLPLTPNPKFSHGYKSMRVSRSFQAQIIESLCTRKATDPRDMFFGIHSILEKLGSSEKLPPVDYSLSCAQTYTNLTQYLLCEGDSLLPLSLAVQKRCEGAPSWVPDYSQDLGILLYESQRLFNMSIFSDVTCGSFPYRRFHPSNASILIVRGYIIPIATQWINICVGDHVALISGLLFPIVVRRKGDRLVELIGPAFFKDLGPFVLWHLICIEMKDYVKERKKKWVEAERSRLPLGSVIEDKPEHYLDDIYIG